MNACIARFKDLSFFLQMPLNVSMTRALPMNCLRIYIHLLGLFYYGCNRHERSLIVNTLYNTIGLHNGRYQFYRLVAKTFSGICEHYVEKLYNAYKPLAHNIEFLRTQVAIANKDWLQEKCAQGRGCLMLTGHFGAVEFLPLALSAYGFKVAMILRYKNQTLKKACEAIANACDAVLIDADQRGVLEVALSAIRSGRILITECDEFKHWKPCKSKQTPVFGVPIPQDRTINVLCRRTRTPTCLGLMKRLHSGYQLLIDPIAEWGEERDICEQSWRKLEQYIMEYPEQWYQWKALSTFIPSVASRGETRAAF